MSYPEPHTIKMYNYLRYIYPLIDNNKVKEKYFTTKNI